MHSHGGVVTSWVAPPPPHPSQPDVNEALIDLPNWEQEFWGASGFQKLQAIKDQWDPTGVFYCGHCIYGTNQSPPPQG
mgnify:CR=1 FL=1